MVSDILYAIIALAVSIVVVLGISLITQAIIYVRNDSLSLGQTKQTRKIQSPTPLSAELAEAVMPQVPQIPDWEIELNSHISLYGENNEEWVPYLIAKQEISDREARIANLHDVVANLVAIDEAKTCKKSQSFQTQHSIEGC